MTDPAEINWPTLTEILAIFPAVFTYGLDPAQFHVVARGGDAPLTRHVEDRWRNRRVEISVIPLEAE